MYTLSSYVALLFLYFFGLSQLALPVAVSTPSSTILPTCNASVPSIIHPSAHGPAVISLFHGTKSHKAAESIIEHGMQLSFGNAAGEFHKRPDIEGGVYLTDSLVSAAQFACYAVEGETPEKVEVLEFLWKGEGIAVYDFKTSDDPNYHKFLNYNGGLDDSFKKEAAKIYENAMITGPMIQNIPGGGDDLTDLFWQYAIVKQAAISHALEFKEHYSNIYCSSIPFGETLSARMYAEGQGGNPAFAKRLAKLQNPKYHPKSSKVVFQQQDAVL